jgi:hypothetical protein
MALIEVALKSYLASQTPITAHTSTRIYPLVIPQDADPLGDKLTYRRKGGPRGHNLTGGNDWAVGVFEIVSWSRSYDNAKDLADAVRNSLQGFIGIFGSGASQVQVGFVKLMDEEDGHYDPEDGSDNGWFAIVCEYHVKYLETAPVL